MSSLLGDRIRTLREEKQLTQLELAKLLKISNTALSQYESGVRTPNDDLKLQIANLFSTSIDYLLGRTNERTVNKAPEFSVDPETLIIFNRATKELPPDALQRLKEFAAREIEYELMKREMNKNK